MTQTLTPEQAKLVEDHLYLVNVTMASIRWLKRGDHQYDEYRSVCNLALVKAAMAFKGIDGATFHNFGSTRVYYAALQQMRDEDHVPLSVRKRLRSIGVKRNEMEQRLGREVSNHEVCSALAEPDTKEYKRLIFATCCYKNASLDEIYESEQDRLPLHETLADTTLIERQRLDETVRQVRFHFRRLNDQQKDVVNRHCQGERLHKIGASYNVSEQRISKILTRSLNMLRNQIKHRSEMNIEAFKLDKKPTVIQERTFVPPVTYHAHRNAWQEDFEVMCKELEYWKAEARKFKACLEEGAVV